MLNIATDYVSEAVAMSLYDLIVLQWKIDRATNTICLTYYFVGIQITTTAHVSANLQCFLSWQSKQAALGL